MIRVEQPEVRQELATLCASVKEFVMRKEYSAAEEMILQSMAKYPHEPEPHNLLGLVLEAQGDHVTAMKHFHPGRCTPHIDLRSIISTSLAASS